MYNGAMSRCVVQIKDDTEAEPSHWNKLATPVLGLFGAWINSPDPTANLTIKGRTQRANAVGQDMMPTMHLSVSLNFWRQT